MKVLATRKVKTRKPHKCWGCCRPIPVGATVSESVSVDGRQAMSSYWCSTCEEFIKTLPFWERVDGWDFGGLLEYDNYPQPVAVRKGENE